jgi:ABC-type glycerol-3-phosphate transport system permease component
MNIYRIIVGTAGVSIVIGVVIALLITGLLYVLIMRIKQADQLTASGYLFAILLAVVLGWHCITIAGAIDLKGKCNDIANLSIASSILGEVQPTVDGIRHKVIDFRDSLDKTIWKSAVWVIVSIVVAVCVIPYTVESGSRGGYDRRNVVHKSDSRYRRRRR